MNLHKKCISFLCAVLTMVLMAAVVSGCKDKAQPETIAESSNVTQGGAQKTPEEPAVTEPKATQPDGAEPESTDPPGENPPEVTAPEEDPYIEPPTEPPVLVVMPDYELTYSGDMSEKIRYEELTGEAGLCFYVRLSSGEVKLFQILINKAAGDFVQMKENSAGEKIPVSFLMESAPEGLSEEDAQTFLMAQDLANDIVGSLILK